MALFGRLRSTPSPVGLSSSLIVACSTSTRPAWNRSRDSAIGPAHAQSQQNSTFTSPWPERTTLNMLQTISTPHVRTLTHPRGLGMFSSLKAFRTLPRAHSKVVCASSIHTWGSLGAKTGPGVHPEGESGGTKSGGGSGEHGSVLAQFVGKAEEPKQVTVATKVVQAGKDTTYLVVILAGFALTGFLFWSVGSEFFSSNSPSAIFTQALKRVKNDPKVADVLGEPITGHGEHSGRGRRRHIPHQEYVVDGVDYMRLKFFVDGSKRKGVATIDLKKNDRGKYECRFLMVELQGAPGGTIIVEDNR